MGLYPNHTQRRTICKGAARCRFTSRCAAYKKERCTLGYSALFLEQVKGVEPSSSAWKADVLAVVRHLRGIADVFYYTRGNTDCQGLFQRVESLES